MSDTAVRTVCDECMEPDGTPNAERLSEIGACIFGCGSKVDRDTGICRKCRDHSANMAECETCGREYQAWDGTWVEVTR